MTRIHHHPLALVGDPSPRHAPSLEDDYLARRRDAGDRPASAQLATVPSTHGNASPPPRVPRTHAMPSAGQPSGAGPSHYAGAAAGGDASPGTALMQDLEKYVKSKAKLDSMLMGGHIDKPVHRDFLVKLNAQFGLSAPRFDHDDGND
jgi:hypothetical protein